MANFFEKIKESLSKTRESVFGKISQAISKKKKIDDELLQEIEEILITGDVGVNTSIEIIEKIKSRVKKEGFENSEEIFNLLKEEISKMLESNAVKVEDTLLQEKPYVILVVGVNGTGKTTSIGKLANFYKQSGRKVMVGAGDTFRAAAIEQLEIWANRAGIEIVKHQSGADPSAVAFDSLKSALSKEIDVLIIDTAGRLHTKTNLMEELKKINRVLKKLMPTTPNEVLLVLDGTTGQNAINQAKQFTQAVGVNGIILTKLDGTAKGGVVISINKELGIPVKYVGTGEKIDDFAIFNPKEFVDGLFEQ